MVPTKINLVYAAINDNDDRREYISIENDNGILLVNPELFVISFNSKEELPYYEVISKLSSIKDKEIKIHRC